MKISKSGTTWPKRIFLPTLAKGSGSSSSPRKAEHAVEEIDEDATEDEDEEKTPQQLLAELRILLRTKQGNITHLQAQVTRLELQLETMGAEFDLKKRDYTAIRTQRDDFDRSGQEKSAQITKLEAVIRSNKRKIDGLALYVVLNQILKHIV